MTLCPIRDHGVLFFISLIVLTGCAGNVGEIHEPLNPSPITVNSDIADKSSATVLETLPEDFKKEMMIVDADPTQVFPMSAKGIRFTLQEVEFININSIDFTPDASDTEVGTDGVRTYKSFSGQFQIIDISYPAKIKLGKYIFWILSGSLGVSLEYEGNDNDPPPGPVIFEISGHESESPPEINKEKNKKIPLEKKLEEGKKKGKIEHSKPISPIELKATHRKKWDSSPHEKIVQHTIQNKKEGYRNHVDLMYEVKRESGSDRISTDGAFTLYKDEEYPLAFTYDCKGHKEKGSDWYHATFILTGYKLKPTGEIDKANIVARRTIEVTITVLEDPDPWKSPTPLTGDTEPSPKPSPASSPSSSPTGPPVDKKKPEDPHGQSPSPMGVKSISLKKIENNPPTATPNCDEQVLPLPLVVIQKTAREEVTYFIQYKGVGSVQRDLPNIPAKKEDTKVQFQISWDKSRGAAKGILEITGRNPNGNPPDETVDIDVDLRCKGLYRVILIEGGASAPCPRFFHVSYVKQSNTLEGQVTANYVSSTGSEKLALQGSPVNLWGGSLGADLEFKFVDCAVGTARGEIKFKEVYSDTGATIATSVPVEIIVKHADDSK